MWLPQKSNINIFKQNWTIIHTRLKVSESYKNYSSDTQALKCSIAFSSFNNMSVITVQQFSIKFSFFALHMDSCAISNVYWLQTGRCLRLASTSRFDLPYKLICNIHILNTAKGGMFGLWNCKISCIRTSMEALYRKS